MLVQTARLFAAPAAARKALVRRPTDLFSIAQRCFSGGATWWRFVAVFRSGKHPLAAFPGSILE